MQNIGFTNASIPGLRYVDPKNLTRAIKRCLTFFNTQPYMAPTIIGVHLNLIEQGQEEMAEKLNPSLSGSLAAIGDTFFWTTLKPLMSLLFLLALIFDQLWGLFLVLVLYNGVHLWTMIWGFVQGYKNGPSGALTIGRMLSVDLSKLISLMIPFLSGVILCLIINWKEINHGPLLGIIIFAACIPALKLRLNPLWIVYGVFALSMIWTMLQ
jgi:mannose/fructose/N-acetylgalactosamine-specific phosphotransferase system component IID